MTRALRLLELAGSFQYTAVLGDSEPDAFERLLDFHRVRLASFHDRPEERVWAVPARGAGRRRRAEFSRS